MEPSAIDSGNTAWVLASSALVLLMTPGLGFFYGGLGRQKNLLNTLAMSWGAMAAVAVAWSLLGYSLAFAPGTPFVGGLSRVILHGMSAVPREGTSIPESAFMLFQMKFALITPALISGAVVGRMRFPAFIAFVVAWSLLVYAPLAHWVWGGGFLGTMGALDFAGGSVVHISAGVAALVTAMVLGPREGGRPADARPHDIPLVGLGAALLWFGWCGFNGGSALAADGIAALAVATTVLAAAAAMVTWALLESMRGGKPTLTGGATGAVVGLVAITPAAGFVSPMSAILIGAIGAAVSFGAIRLLSRTRLDDSLDVFACHGVGGAVGSILTGVFASRAVNPAGADGLLSGGPILIGKQLVAVGAAAGLSAVGTVAVLFALKRFVRLRADAESERLGLDQAEHGELPYSPDLVMPAPAGAPLPQAAPEEPRRLG